MYIGEPQYIESVRVTPVIEVKIIRGTGKNAMEIKREVTQFWSVSGKLISEIDPCNSLKDGEK